MTGLCLAGAGLVVALNADALTLVWRHSVEKTLWEEDWALRGGRVALVEARVAGSGAGMEPPPEARLVGGAWRWTPSLAPLPEVVLRRSGATADWRVCISGHCRSVEELLPAADPVILKSC
jgi:hypothetical protein